MISYEGNEKYIFVSYAHKDSEMVIPIIEAMDKLGFRIWYDTGIEAGTEWPAFIEEHLYKSEVVLVFMSPHAVASVNCRNEINYAASIKKEMLVVYLTETELAKGMNLQLSSLQSMFRYRHESAKSFIDELSKAKILQCCKGEKDVASNENDTINDFNAKVEDISHGMDFESAQNSGDRNIIKQSRQFGPSVIANVGTKPSNNPNDPWPNTGYSNVINIDSYKSIHFHCNLVKPIYQDESKTVGLQVYNQDNALVFENISTINFKVGNDRFSKGWLIRNSEGMTMNPGVYTAILWVDNSRVAEHTIRLISNKSPQPTPNPYQNNGQFQNNPYGYNNYPAPGGYPNNQYINTPYPGYQPYNPPPQGPSPEAKKEILALKKKLRIPKIFRLNLVVIILFIIGSGLISTEDETNIALGIVLFWMTCIPFIIPVFVMTKNNVIKNGFLAFLAVFLGCGYYQIYLTVMLFITLANKKKWKARIAELEKSSGNYNPPR